MQCNQVTAVMYLPPTVFTPYNNHDLLLKVGLFLSLGKLHGSSQHSSYNAKDTLGSAHYMQNDGWYESERDDVLGQV